MKTPLSNYQKKQCEKFIKNVAKLIAGMEYLNTIIYYSKFHYEKSECKKYSKFFLKCLKEILFLNQNYLQRNITIS